jgi:hypothetical protein
MTLACILSKRLSQGSNNKGRNLGRPGNGRPYGLMSFVSGSRRALELKTKASRLPTQDSRLPTQDSRLPTQDSLRPVYLGVFIVPVSRVLEGQRRLQS